MDNNTWNNTHISRVGQAMASDEQHAYEIMKELDVDYVLGELDMQRLWHKRLPREREFTFYRIHTTPLWFQFTYISLSLTIF